MIQGENKLQLIKFDVDITLVNKIVVTYEGDKGKVTKSYPTDITYENKILKVPLKQEDTLALCNNKPSIVNGEVQINFKNGQITKHKLPIFIMEQTLGTDVVTGDTPNDAMAEIKLDDLGNVVVISNGNNITQAQIESIVTSKINAMPKASSLDTVDQLGSGNKDSTIVYTGDLSTKGYKFLYFEIRDASFAGNFYGSRVVPVSVFLNATTPFHISTNAISNGACSVVNSTSNGNKVIAINKPLSTSHFICLYGIK